MTPIEGGSNSHTAQPLVNTSAQSWSEADLAALSTGKARGRIQRRQGRQAGTDHARRRGVGAGNGDAAAAVGQRHTRRRRNPSASPRTRVVAVGDSDFAANMAIGISGNRDFFMNSMNWLSQQENLIAVRPRQPEDRRLTLTADQQNRIMILTLFIIPGLVFAIRRLHLVEEALTCAASLPRSSSSSSWRGSAPTSTSSIRSGRRRAPTARRRRRRRSSPSRPTRSTSCASPTRANRRCCRKSDGGWKMVEPAQIDADPPEAIGVATALTNVEIVRVVDENATNLEQFGLANPQITVAFKADGGASGTLEARQQERDAGRDLRDEGRRARGCSWCRRSRRPASTASRSTCATRRS